MENSFQYPELGTPRETRLIKLRTDVGQDAPLSCELVTTSIDNPDPYVALSYTWGNYIGRERMAVLPSGHALTEDEPAIPVTPNCAAALRKLRASDLIRRRGVWVDAICINQDSKDDKSIQVEMMAEIYEKAAAVAVLLGEKWAPERYENVAASTAWYLHTVCELPNGQGSTEFLMRRLKHHVEHAGSTKLEAGVDLTRNHCKSGCGLCQGSKYCPTLGLWIALRTKPQNQSESAEDALKMIRNSLPVGASDSRDKVFAFRALLPKTLKGVSVDYNRPVADIFTSATRTYIEAHSNLDILYEATRNPTKLSSARASSCSEPSFKFSEDSTVLRLKGRKIGEVGGHAGNFCPAERFIASAESHRGDRLDVDFNEILRTLSEFVLDEYTDKVAFSTAQDRYQAFRRLLLRYAKGDRTLSFALSMFFGPNADAAQSLQRAGSVEASARRIPTHIISALSGGMLFLTTEGRFALGFCALQREDLICVFAVLRIPFIVRPEGSSFTLVGYAYVDGVMDGERWPNNGDDLTRWEIL